MVGDAALGVPFVEQMAKKDGKGCKKMNFKILNVGQIKEASVEFGDLTLLVGAQGTGKSIFLQLFKLVQDQDYIKNIMRAFGQDWGKKSRAELMAAYFSRGMGHIWGAESGIFRDGNDAAPSPEDSGPFFIFNQTPFGEGTFAPTETVYYIPAQRVVTMPGGWPLPYRTYTPRDPFAFKNFSERIRLYLEGLDIGEILFPVTQKIKQPILDVFDKTIFHRASVSLDASNGQKEVRLNVNGDKGKAISYMAWSTGQREFLPLLLGCYELLPENPKTKREEIEWVILEEPEMGLHPMGIFAVMALVLDLLSRGYKVVISTHSANVLDVIWSIEAIKRQTIDESQKIALIAKLLDLPTDGVEMTEMIGKVLGLAFKTHCFYYGEDGYVHTKDISSLYPGDDDEMVAGWGGLTDYGARAADVVAEAVSMSQDE